jgi:assimilatory nitrate reductase catalytic subunit
MARTLGIKQDDRLRLSSRRGSAIFKARLSRTIRLDTVFIPFHWGGEATANLLTSTYTDPISGIPEFKVCAVHVARAGPGRSAAAAAAMDHPAA